MAAPPPKRRKLGRGRGRAAGAGSAADDGQLGSVEGGAPATPMAPGVPCPGTPLFSELICIKCEEPTSLAGSVPAGPGNLLCRRCNLCKRIGEAMTAANIKNRAIKLAFSRMNAEDQLKYYRAQKRKREVAAEKEKCSF